MKLALLGDTMLGRKVGERLAIDPAPAVVDGGLVEAVHEADLVVANLECALSDRGEPWPDPTKPFFFRAPPAAVDVLAVLGVDCVTLANNHALDFGTVALLDTFRHLRDAGIEFVGAGVDAEAARLPAVLHCDGAHVAVIGATDHPAAYAANAGHPGVAYADLRHGVPDWLTAAVEGASADVVLAFPHWGPNMVTEPVPHVRAAAAALLRAGATVVAGHSAHVFHGAAPRVLYDLGDFIDDYARDPALHNELGLLWFVTFDGAVPTEVEAVPIALDYCRTRLATASEATWIADRLRAACAALGTEPVLRDGRLVIAW